MIPNGGILLRILGRLDQIHLAAIASVNVGNRKAPGLRKELQRQRVGGVRHAVWNLWLASTDVVFENTTSIDVSEDHLHGLLVVLLYGFFVFATLSSSMRDIRSTSRLAALASALRLASLANAKAPRTLAKSSSVYAHTSPVTTATNRAS